MSILKANCVKSRMFISPRVIGICFKLIQWFTSQILEKPIQTHADSTFIYEENRK